MSQFNMFIANNITYALLSGEFVSELLHMKFHLQARKNKDIGAAERGYWGLNLQHMQSL